MTRTQLALGAAALAIVAGGGGVLIGRASDHHGAPVAAGERSHDSGKAETAEGGEAKEASGEAPGVIAMDADRILAAGIATEPAQVGGSEAGVLAQGQVTATPSGQAVLAAVADGAVIRILKRLGDPVRAGDTLVVLQSRDAASLVAEGATARAKLLAAQQAYTRERRLFDAKITARQDLEGAQAALTEAQAEARRASSSATAAHLTRDGSGIAVVSPIAGRVTAAPAVLGAYVSAGAELFRVTDPAKVQVEASVAASDLAHVHVGDRAIIETSDGQGVDAVVRSTTPALDPQSRAATIVLAPAAKTPLQPGQAVRVHIASRGAGSSTISLPEEAVQSVGGRDVVFVRVERGFRPTPVAVGARSAGRVEVLSGLRPGEIVATRGAFSLKSETAKSAGDSD